MQGIPASAVASQSPLTSHNHLDNRGEARPAMTRKRRGKRWTKVKKRRITAVESVDDHRVLEDGSVKFLVKWVSIKTKTEEPREHFEGENAQRILDEYCQANRLPPYGSSQLARGTYETSTVQTSSDEVVITAMVTEEASTSNGPLIGGYSSGASHEETGPHWRGHVDGILADRTPREEASHRLDQPLLITYSEGIENHGGKESTSQESCGQPLETTHTEDIVYNTTDDKECGFQYASVTSLSRSITEVHETQQADLAMLEPMLSMRAAHPLLLVARMFLDGIKSYQRIVFTEDAVDLSTPALFRPEACWRAGIAPPWKTAWEHVYSNMTKGVCYSRAEIDQPTDIKNSSQAIEAFFKPGDKEVVYFVMNVPTPDFDQDMHVPELVSRTFTIVENTQTSVSCNFTPEGAFTDLHIDHGTQGVAATARDGIKLWLFYPPTPHNIALLYTDKTQRNLLSRLRNRLHGGMYTITTEKEVLWLPAGWIHAVLTIKSTILFGINYVAQEDVEIAGEIFRKTHQHYQHSQQSFDVFIECCYAAMCSPVLSLREKATIQWCRSIPMICEKYRGHRLRECICAKFEDQGQCACCHKPTSEHNLWKGRHAKRRTTGSDEVVKRGRP